MVYNHALDVGDHLFERYGVLYVHQMQYFHVLIIGDKNIIYVVNFITDLIFPVGIHRTLRKKSLKIITKYLLPKIFFMQDILI